MPNETRVVELEELMAQQELDRLEQGRTWDHVDAGQDPRDFAKDTFTHEAAFVTVLGRPEEVADSPRLERIVVHEEPDENLCIRGNHLATLRRKSRAR